MLTLSMRRSDDEMPFYSPERDVDTSEGTEEVSKEWQCCSCQDDSDQPSGRRSSLKGVNERILIPVLYLNSPMRVDTRISLKGLITVPHLISLRRVET